MKWLTFSIILIGAFAARAGPEEARTSAIAWIMDAQSIMNYEKFSALYNLEFTSYDLNEDDEDVKIWFRFRSQSNVCDVHVGSETNLVRDAKCAVK